MRNRKAFGALVAIGLAVTLAGQARAQDADASRFGVNAHLAGDPLLEKLADIGIKWYRIDIGWSDVEKVEGQREWADIDRVVDFCGRRGLRVYGTIAYTPSWASGSNDPAAPPRDASKYHDFVREVARRYRGRVHAFGIWNEPNLGLFWKGTKQQYLDQILLPGLRILKEEVPEIPRCGPDLSSSGNYRKDWLEPILRAAGSQLDVITQHQYDGKDTVSGRVKELDSLRSYLQGAGQGGKPFWLTEIGWMTGKKVSANDQASNLKGIYQAMLSRSWWSKTFWYDSHGVGWGLLGPDATAQQGQPTPSYSAYRDVIQGAPAPAPTPAPAPAPAPPDALLSPGGLATASTPDRNERWVQALYRDVLGRGGDAGGVAAHTGALGAGTKPVEIARNFLDSDEGLQRFVRDLSTRLLGHEAGADARAGYRAAWAELLSSGDYQSLHQGEEAWVRAVYRDVLGRDASAAEVSGQVQALIRSGDRRALAE
jgi:hypothetical protein